MQTAAKTAAVCCLYRYMSSCGCYLLPSAAFCRSRSSSGVSCRPFTVRGALSFIVPRTLGVVPGLVGSEGRACGGVSTVGACGREGREGRAFTAGGCGLLGLSYSFR